MRISKCCQCFTLKKGSIIFGVINLMGGIALLIFLSYFTSQIHYNSYITNPKRYFIAKAKMAGLITYVVSTIILLSTLLIIGAIIRSAILLLPSICISFAHIILNIAAFVGVYVFLWSYSSMPPMIMFCGLLAGGLGLTLQYYRWLIIFKFYKELVAEKYGYTLDDGEKIYQQSLDHRV